MDVSTLVTGAVLAIAAALAALAVGTRFGGRVRGSFGSGFVGFRGDGWPRGVQEDDDARWGWGQAAPPPPTLRWLRPTRPSPPAAPQRR